MNTEARIREILERQPFYQQVKAGDYYASGGGTACRIYSMEVIDALAREWPELPTVMIENDFLIATPEGLTANRDTAAKDHAYVAAYTPELGLFLIDPTAGQFLKYQYRYLPSAIPFDDIFIGSKAKLVETMKRHGMMERDIWRCWSACTVPSLDRFPSVTTDPMWMKADGHNIPVIALDFASNGFESTARQAFVLEKLGVDWEKFVFGDDTHWHSNANIKAYLSIIKEKNSFDIDFPPDEILKRAFVAAHEDLTRVKGGNPDPRSIAADLNTIVWNNGENWQQILQDAVLTISTQTGRIADRAYYRDAAELLTALQHDTAPKDWEDDVRKMEEDTTNSLWAVKSAARGLTRTASGHLLGLVAAAEIDTLKRQVPNLDREAAIEARQKTLLQRQRTTFLESTRDSLQTLARYGRAPILSDRNRFGLES